MEETSLLETTAEISVAFTGFIGIFLVLAARNGRFQPLEAFAIRLIVICSITPVFLAFLPLILSSLGISGTMLWRVSSIIAGLALVTSVSYMIRQLRSLEHGEGRDVNYGFVLGLLTVVSCTLNAIGWPISPSGGLYLVTVWSIIGIAGGNFVELLFKKLL